MLTNNSEKKPEQTIKFPDIDFSRSLPGHVKHKNIRQGHGGYRHRTEIKFLPKRQPLLPLARLNPKT